MDMGFVDGAAEAGCCGCVVFRTGLLAVANTGASVAGLALAAHVAAGRRVFGVPAASAVRR